MTIQEKLKALAIKVGAKGIDLMITSEKTVVWLYGEEGHVHFCEVKDGNMFCAPTIKDAIKRVVRDYKNSLK